MGLRFWCLRCYDGGGVKDGDVFLLWKRERGRWGELDIDEGE